MIGDWLVSLQFEARWSKQMTLMNQNWKLPKTYKNDSRLHCTCRFYAICLKPVFKQQGTFSVFAQPHLNTRGLGEFETVMQTRHGFFMLTRRNYCRNFYCRLRKEKQERERVKQRYTDNLRDKETKLKRSEAWQEQLEF